MRDYKDYYKQGFLDGIRCFAHWKDGVQYVGTAGMKLSYALEEIENLVYFSYPIPEDKTI